MLIVKSWPFDPGRARKQGQYFYASAHNGHQDQSHIMQNEKGETEPISAEKKKKFINVKCHKKSRLTYQHGLRGH